MATGVTGSPRLVGVVNPFDVSSGSSTDSTFFNVQNPKYGGTFDGLTDVGHAITAAAADLSAAGGGTLYFPPGVYPVYTSATTPLATFAGLNGVAIRAYGASFNIPLSRVFTTSYHGFVFDTCSNILIEGISGTGPTQDLTLASAKGVELIEIGKGCTNVTIRDVRLSGYALAVQFIRDPSIGDAKITGADLSNISVTNCYYGVTAQFGPDNLRIANLRTDGVHRSFYAYGIRNADVTIFSKDPYSHDVLLYSYAGHGIENLRLRYMSDETTQNASDGCWRVELAWGDSTPAIHRNIDIELDIVYAATGNTGSSAFIMSKYSDGGVTMDTSDRGHRLDGLTVRGLVEGLPHYTAYAIIGTRTECVWGTGDFWSNVALRNLRIKNGKIAFFTLGSLVDSFLVENFTSDNSLGLWQSISDQTPPHNGRYTIINSNFPNRDTRVLTDGVVGGLDQIRFVGPTGTIYAGYTEHFCTNNGAGSGDVNPLTLPAAVAGLTFPVLRTDAGLIRLGTSGTDVFRGQTLGKLLNIDTQGGAVTVACKSNGTWDVIASNGAFSYV